jgi:hypothetical protein
MALTVLRSRLGRFLRAQSCAWRELFVPAKPVVELLRAPQERAHPSQLCHCFGDGGRRDHRPDCSWMAVRCRSCSGIGRCSSCGGDGVDPAAHEVFTRAAGAVNRSASEWGPLDETRISNASAYHAAGVASAAYDEPYVGFDVSDTAARR